MPHWWVELTTIPGMEDPKKLAKKICTSFRIPAVRCKASLGQGYTAPHSQMYHQEYVSPQQSILSGHLVAAFVAVYTVVFNSGPFYPRHVIHKSSNNMLNLSLSLPAGGQGSQFRWCGHVSSSELETGWWNSVGKGRQMPTITACLPVKASGPQP